MTKVHLPGSLRSIFWRKEDHRQALAAALGVPEDAQPFGCLDVSRFTQFDHLGDGLVYAKILVVLGHLLDQTAPRFLEQREVLNDVQQPGLVAQATNGGIQCRGAGLFLVIDTLPLEEVLPALVIVPTRVCIPLESMMKALGWNNCGMLWPL